MAGICGARFDVYGTAGQASKFAPMPMAEIAHRYASGSLDPTNSLAPAAA